MNFSPGYRTFISHRSFSAIALSRTLLSTLWLQSIVVDTSASTAACQS